MSNRFPCEAALRDGRRILIRPFSQDDVPALVTFFQRLPAEVRRFAWENISDRSVVEEWGRNLDYSKALPLLGFDGQRIVADATLHYRDRGPLRLVGRVKWLIDPEYRGRGLGTILINHFISIGRSSGLRHLTCMLISDLEADAIRTLAGLGFTSHTIPGYGTDPDGNQHDMTMMVLRF